MYSSPILLDFSDTLTEERLAEHLAGRSPIVCDCRAIDGCGRFCDDAAADEIRSRTAEMPADGLHWIDSGDYHFVTLFWCEKIREQFDLVLFDNHTDMQEPRFEGLLSCGSWLLEMLRRNPFLRHAYIIGASETLRCETLGFADRVTMVSGREPSGTPENEAASILREAGLAAPECDGTATDCGVTAPECGGQAPDCGGTATDCGTTAPDCGGDKKATDGSNAGPECDGTGPADNDYRRPPLYISVDKDVLSPADAATNWDQGPMRLATLCAILRQLRAGHRIIGADICGGAPVNAIADLSANCCSLHPVPAAGLNLKADLALINVFL